MFSRFRNIFSKSKKDKESDVTPEVLTTPLEPKNTGDKMSNEHIESYSKAESTLKETSEDNEHLGAAKVKDTPEFKESVGDEADKVKESNEINGETTELTVKTGDIKETEESEKTTKDLDAIERVEDLQEPKNFNTIESIFETFTDNKVHNVQEKAPENITTQALNEPNADEDKYEIEQNVVQYNDDNHVTQNGSTYAELEEISASKLSPVEHVEEVKENVEGIPKEKTDELKQIDTIGISMNINSTHKILENSNDTDNIAINIVLGVSRESPTQQAADIISKAKSDNYNSAVFTHNSKSMPISATLDPAPITITNDIISTNKTNDIITNDSSAMSDDLTNNEVITSPSTTDSGNGGSELNTTAATIATPEATSPSSTLSSSSSSSTTLAAAAAATRITPTTLVVTPTGNNDIACSAITNKLTEISEVAESLDAAIRDVQEDADLAESQSTSSSTEKKLDNLRSTSIEVGME